MPVVEDTLFYVCARTHLNLSLHNQVSLYIKYVRITLSLSVFRPVFLHVPR